MMRKSASPRARFEPLESRTLFAISFADPVDYPVTGNTFTQPALADFNGDGFLDAATCANQQDENSVSVLLNQGNGTFGVETVLPVGARPFQVIGGDFNGDTKQDLACTNIVDGTLSVLLGNGDGTFQPPVNSTFGATANVGIGSLDYLVATELNGDGKLDLFVNNDSDNKLETLLGNGDGTFIVKDEQPGFFGPLAVADFNGDGHPDVASNIGNDSAVVVHFSDGAGNLDGESTIPFVSTLSGIFSVEGTVAGDFNADGKADIAVTTLSFAGGQNAPSDLGVFLGNGDGTFQANVNTQLPNGSLDISVADLDNDGTLDAVTDGISGFLALRGNGDGTFATPPDITNASFNTDGAATIGDLNNDGTRDLAFAKSGSDTDSLSVFLAGQPGGGGGGGTGVKKATPSIQATLPAAVIAGEKVKGAKVSVVVTNDGTETLNEPVTIDLFISTDATYDSADTAAGAPLTKKLKLNAGASKAIKVKLASLPTVADGDYFLLARTTAAGATGGTSASTGKITIAAPFVDLGGAFGTLPAQAIIGRPTTVSLAVTNSGNTATGAKSINIVVVGRPTTGADVPITTVPVKINLKANATKTLKLKLPIDEPLEPGFNYLLGATIDSGGILGETNLANNLVWSVGPLLVLQGASAL